jgi:hypothetical protein
VSRPKVRADAHGLAQLLAGYGCNLDQLPPGPDGWHTRESIFAGLRHLGHVLRADRAVQANRWPPEPRPVAASAPALPDPVQEAYRAGKITASAAADWAAKYQSDPEGVAYVLGNLDPVLPPPDDYADLFPVAAASGGYVARHPTVDASPRLTSHGYANAVEELRAGSAAAVVAQAELAEPAPEMFPGSGDYPAETASGINPSVLTALPWRARLAAAWEPNRAEAFRISQRYAEPDGELAAAEELRTGAVADYEARVMAWAHTHGTKPQPTDQPGATE